MAALTVDPVVLWKYATQFYSAGEQWPKVVQALQGADIPQDSFGSGPLSPLQNVFFQGEPQPVLYNAYHQFWQKYSTLAGAAQQTMNDWDSALSSVALNYYNQDQKQASSMKQVAGPQSNYL